MDANVTKEHFHSKNGDGCVRACPKSCVILAAVSLVWGVQPMTLMCNEKTHFIRYGSMVAAKWLING